MEIVGVPSPARDDALGLHRVETVEEGQGVRDFLRADLFLLGPGLAAQQEDRREVALAHAGRHADRRQRLPPALVDPPADQLPAQAADIRETGLELREIATPTLVDHRSVTTSSRKRVCQ